MVFVMEVIGYKRIVMIVGLDLLNHDFKTNDTILNRIIMCAISKDLKVILKRNKRKSFKWCSFN